MHSTILGDGHLGWAVAAAAGTRGERTPILGRPTFARHDPVAFGGTDVVIDCSRGEAVLANLGAAIDAGVRRFVIASTGWADARDEVATKLQDAGAIAVVSANFSLGVAIFGRLVDTAAALFRTVEGFDPYLVEWHRRGKVDRPSGTALDLARRLTGPAADPSELEVVSVRAGSSPGMHLVGFDAAGETVELRITARDRSAYANGILAATDWLRRAPRAPGIHTFEPVVDELLASPAGLAA